MVHSAATQPLLSSQHSPPKRTPLTPSLPPPSTTFHDTPLFPHPSRNTFSDSHNRTILLRGLNVSGSSKVPGWKTNDRGEKVVSYTGRPFKDMKEAEDCWRGLRMWGVGVVRWVMTWEAIEPVEMGVYDEEYIEYTYEVLKRADEAGLKVFVDSHQDCFSRISGGSGAPAWTFHLIGLKTDPTLLRETYTASLLPVTTPSPTSASYIFTEPNMPPVSTKHSTPSSHLWPTNYNKLASLTMFTIFFSGDTFTSPDKHHPEFNLLQTAYVNAFEYLAYRLAGLSCILGFDIMNEPHPGYIGLETLEEFDQNVELHLGGLPSAVQGMVLSSGGCAETEPPSGAHGPGEGITVKVPIYVRSFPVPSRVEREVDVVLSKENRVWLDGRVDIWHEAGVWEWDRVPGGEKRGFRCRDEKYFTKDPHTGKEIDFERDFYEKFVRRFLSSVERGRRRWVDSQLQYQHAFPPGTVTPPGPTPGGMGKWGFVEPVPNLGPMVWIEGGVTEPPHAPRGEEPHIGGGICYSPHWYDLRACFDKALSYRISFDVGALAKGSRNFYKHTYFGARGLKNNYTTQLRRLVSHLSTFRPSGVSTPVLIGETGVPFDINGFRGYRDGECHDQLVMLDCVCSAMERCMDGGVNWTLWNWTGLNDRREGNPDGTDSPQMLETGDHWNSEDFSLVSLDPSMVEVPLIAPSPTSPQHRPPTNLSHPLTRAARFHPTLYAGARCIGAWIRPYPPKTAGVLVKSEFEVDVECWEGGSWGMEYLPSMLEIPSTASALARTTEIFLPAYHFGGKTLELTLGCTFTKRRKQERQIAISSDAAEGTVDFVNDAGAAVELTYRYSENEQGLVVIHQITPSTTNTLPSSEIKLHISVSTSPSSSLGRAGGRRRGGVLGGLLIGGRGVTDGGLAETLLVVIMVVVGIVVGWGGAELVGGGGEGVVRAG